MLANYHTHTVRCGHAVDSERKYIEHAIEQGFEILGFSDHVPQPYPEDFASTIRMSMEELPGYIETLVVLREEYRDRIKLLIGFEVEYSVRFFDKLIGILGEYPVDYIIQGQHNVPDEVYGIYVGNRTGKEKDLKDYVDCTIEGMKTGLFTYLAHPDLINFTGDDVTYLRHMERLAAASIDLSIPLEVNMYGFSDRRNYPCDKFFKMASDMGADFVIGCDAHEPSMVTQPENIYGLVDFLKRNNIKYGDNIVKTIRPIRN
jgi:histidinol-phosphatase (PHP family)